MNNNIQCLVPTITSITTINIHTTLVSLPTHQYLTTMLTIEMLKMWEVKMTSSKQT